MEAAGEGTVFTPSLERMKHVKSDNGEMLTKPFLDVCKLILPVIGSFRISSLYYSGYPTFSFLLCLKATAEAHRITKLYISFKSLFDISF